MEQNLSNKNQLANTSKEPSWVPLAKEIAHVNLLVAYPIPDAMLDIWAKTIEELTPDLTPDKLKKIIDRMKLGELEYDPKFGIQNIFKAYRESMGVKRFKKDLDENGKLIDVPL